jgi:hypothetical protein
VQHAVTNDSSIDGDDYRDFGNERVYDANGDAITWSYDNLLGIDSFSGTVHVNFDVLDSYDLLATYSYKEQHFELTGLNMNPVFDQTVHSELRAVYIVPKSSVNGNTVSQIESVRWVKVSSSGLINSTNQTGDGGNEKLSNAVQLATTDGYKISGIVGLHYSWRASTTSSSLQDVISGNSITVSSTSTFPHSGWIRFVDATNSYMRYARYTSKTDTTLEMSSDATEVPSLAAGLFIGSGTTVELVNFKDDRTTLSNRTAASELSYAPSTSGFIPTSFSRYFMLAEMATNPPHSHNDLVIIDLREDGGGVKPDRYEEAKLLQPQIQWLNDFGDFRGQLYPGNAVVVVKLPATLLNSFTEIEIKQIVDENMPLGVKPLIRYYGYEPNIISVLPVLS